MVKIFGFGKEDKPKRRKSGPRKKVSLAEVCDKTLIRQAQDDKEWALQMALQKEGLKVDGPVEKQQKKIDEFITKKALEELESGESELLDDVVREKISTILGSGQKRRGRGESEYYEPGSSISQALEEVESLSELREKLQELGMVEGGGKGFFKGISMKDILEALPFVSALTGRGGEPPIRTYLVRIDGENREVTESQYRQLLQEGKIQPIAALESPKPKAPKEEPVEEVLTEEVLAEIPELPEFLQGVDFTIIEGWFEQEPEDFVINLKAEVDSELEQSMLAWGFLTTATYEGIVEKVTPYREHPEVGNLVQRVLSDEGKVWLTRVLELVKETLNE